MLMDTGYRNVLFIITSFCIQDAEFDRPIIMGNTINRREFQQIDEFCYHIYIFVY